MVEKSLVVQKTLVDAKLILWKTNIFNKDSPLAVRSCTFPSVRVAELRLWAFRWFWRRTRPICPSAGTSQLLTEERHLPLVRLFPSFCWFVLRHRRLQPPSLRRGPCPVAMTTAALSLTDQTSLHACVCDFMPPPQPAQNVITVYLLVSKYTSTLARHLWKPESE